MNPQNRSIFRVSAIQGYMQAKVQPVLPRFIAPPVPLCLWVLMSTLIFGGALVAFTPVPVYSRGEAAIIDWRGQTRYVTDEAIVVAFFPPETRSRLRVGQRLLLKLNPDGEVRASTIIAVEPAISSPADARQRFMLAGEAAQAPRLPSAIAIARFAAPDERLSPLHYVGSRSEVEVQTGARRIISFFPYVGKFFGE